MVYIPVLMYDCMLSILNCLDTERYRLIQEAVKAGLQVPLKFLKFVFFGPPGAGKTTFVRRLIGEIDKISPDCVQPSTLTADQKELIIKVCLDKESHDNRTLVVNPTSEWCSVSEEEGKCSLDEEALMIYRFIHVNDEGIQQETLDLNSPVADTNPPSLPEGANGSQMPDLPTISTVIPDTTNESFVQPQEPMESIIASERLEFPTQSDDYQAEKK